MNETFISKAIDALHLKKKGIYPKACSLSYVYISEASEIYSTAGITKVKTAVIINLKY